MSAALSAYLALSRIAAPAGRLILNRRAARGREDKARLAERRGVASVARPEGVLVWTHAASVGEALAALTLIEALDAARPGLRHLLTTGTLTSARLMAARAPTGVIHQFAPLDIAPWLARFLAHWRPDLALRIDSEIWPATLCLTRAPIALVNARVSARSAARWGRFAPGLIAALLGHVALALPQDAASGARLVELGLDAGRLGPALALKSAAAPPEADAAELARWRDALGARPVLLAASTHPEDEPVALEAQARLAGAVPGLLTIIAPRHPERGPALARQTGAPLRSAGAGPGAGALYIADTLGEMGLWLRLADFVYVGGGMSALGGHTPYEAAALGRALAHGPDTAAFADAYAALAEAGAARCVRDGATLAEAALAGLRGAEALGARARAALAPDPDAARRAAEAALALLP